MPPEHFRENKRILILMPDKHMGNLIVSLPILYSICKTYHNNLLLIDERYKDIVNGFGLTKNTLYYPRRILKENSLKGFLALIKLLYEIRRWKPHIAIDLYGENNSALLCFLSGASGRIGKANNDLSRLYTDRVTLTRGRHKSENYLDIAKSLGISEIATLPEVEVMKKWQQSLIEKLKKQSIENRDNIVSIHPGAGKIYKEWTVEGYVDVINFLYSRGFKVVLIGAGRDKVLGEKINQLTYPRSISLIDKLSIGELIFLFKISKLFIGTDSGPMHLAAVSKTPVIALFGPAREERWAPLSEKVTILRGASPCLKCRGKDCELEFRCIKALHPNKVKEAIGQYL